MQLVQLVVRPISRRLLQASLDGCLTILTDSKIRTSDEDNIFFLMKAIHSGVKLFLLALKPGSHLCDKHNTSDISISISTRKKGTCSFFLVLMLMLMSLVLCLSHKCEPGFSRR